MGLVARTNENWHAPDGLSRGAFWAIIVGSIAGGSLLLLPLIAWISRRRSQKKRLEDERAACNSSKLASTQTQSNPKYTTQNWFIAADASPERRTMVKYHVHKNKNRCLVVDLYRDGETGEWKEAATWKFAGMGMGPSMGLGITPPGVAKPLKPYKVKACDQSWMGGGESRRESEMSDIV